jgi:hypothetical protein
MPQSDGLNGSSTPEVCPSEREGPEDQDFPPNEKFYRRVPPALFNTKPHYYNLRFKDDNQLDPGYNISVNRGKYSGPNCAICEQMGVKPGCRVIEFTVLDLGNIRVRGCLALAPRHKIDQETPNYSHSEIRLFRNGKEIEPERVSRTLRREIAEELAKRVLEIAPDPNHVCRHAVNRQCCQQTESQSPTGAIQPDAEG